jgi:serine protease Do
LRKSRRNDYYIRQNEYARSEYMLTIRRFLSLFGSTAFRVIVLAAAIVALSASGSALHAQPTGKKKLPVDLSTAIVQVAKQNIPAVVHIDVIEKQEVSNPFSPFEDDPFFRYFFGTPNAPRKFQRELRGIGTGMIIDGSGHILTNHHVAGGATKVEVSLSDGRKFPAKLVGSDPKTDLAVIRINARDLPRVTFGDSDKTEVGEWVIAIGHPRGLDQTVTQGIISAKHRTGITDPTGYQDFLQTDAAINPGNSGGPLLNLYGEVIGINTVISSQSGGSEGIGFAIPSNMALYVARTIISHGKMERGWLGVGVQDLNPDLARSLNVPATRGALINEVVKGGPADRAGLKKGDVIVSFHGNEVIDGGALRTMSALSPVGQDVKVVAVRQGKRYEFTVKTGDLREAARFTAETTKERLGAQVRAVTGKESDRLGLDANQGVVISWVDPKGPLGAAGFEVGDVILAINGQAITGLDTFIELTGSLKPRQRVTLLAVDHTSGRSGTIQVVTK